METPKTVEEILPLIAVHVPEDRALLIRLALQLSHQDAATYQALPPRPHEFSSDHTDPLAWDAEGWETFH